jgi:hypothetical protein
MVRKLLTRLLAVAIVCAVLPILSQAAPAQAAALRRAISDTNPMFVLTVASNQPQSTIQNIINTVPADLKPYVVVSLYYEPITDSAARSWFDTQLTIADQLGVKANAQIANGWTSSSVDLAFVESMYQNHPSFIGPVFAELYGTKYGTVADMLNLSAQYGGFVFNIDYTNGSNGMLSAHSSPAMLAAMRAHPDNYIPIAKQTTSSRYHETEAIANGLWASGLAGNWGVNPDTWTWWETGRAGLFKPEPGHRGADDWKAVTTYPEAQISEVMLQSALAGATVFTNFEHYSYTHFNNGATTPAFVKEIIPTMREIVGKDLIPTRAAARSKIKVAFLSDNDQINNDYYSDLYADGTNIDWLRTSGRYYIIPLLVSGTNATERGYFPEVISTSQYTSLFPTVTAKLNYFNSRYPPDALGSATAQNFLTDKWLILNNLENTNQLQNTVAYPRVATVDTFGMTMPPNTYAIVDEDASALKFHIGNYNVNKASIWSQGDWTDTEFQNWIRTVYQVSPDESDTRTTVIQVNGHTGGSKPAISVTGYNGYNGYTYADSWDSANKTYRLSITHNGPIDVTINAWGDNSAHNRPTDSSPIVIQGETAAFSGASRAMGNSAASGGQVAGFSATAPRTMRPTPSAHHQPGSTTPSSPPSVTARAASPSARTAEPRRPSASKATAGRLLPPPGSRYRFKPEPTQSRSSTTRRTLQTSTHSPSPPQDRRPARSRQPSTPVNVSMSMAPSTPMAPKSRSGTATPPSPSNGPCPATAPSAPWANASTSPEAPPPTTPPSSCGTASSAARKYGSHDPTAPCSTRNQAGASTYQPPSWVARSPRTPSSPTGYTRP